MAEMKLEVQVLSVRNSESGKHYAEFLFPGGMLSLLVSSEMAGKLRDLVGSNAVFSFDMAPRIVILFNRPSVVFEVRGIKDGVPADLRSQYRAKS